MLTPAGLIFLDGYYYYVRTSSGEVIHGRTYWITVTNGLMPQGMHHFDDDGRMMDPPANAAASTIEYAILPSENKNSREEE